MTAPASLNDSITAAWSTSAPKKRVAKRTIALNSASSSLPSSPGAGPSTAVDGLGTSSAGSQVPEDSAPSTSNTPGRLATPPRQAVPSASTIAPSSGPSHPRKRQRRNPEQLAEKYAPPDLKLSSLGGLREQIEQLTEIVALPLLHPEIYLHTGVDRPRGVLLHGVPGGGKTQLVKCLAGELGLPFINVSAPSIVSGMSGESEKTLRETFDEARKVAPCLLFLDEIDAITPKRETAQREMERRIVAQLLTCIDDLSTSEEPVIIVGATNRPDSLDPALRRAGRFDHEIEMGVPSLEAREEILRVLCQKLRLSDDVDFRWLAKATPGYVGADLAALTTEAGVIAVKRMFHDIAEGRITLGDEVQNMVIDDAPFASLPEDLRSTPIFRFLSTHRTPLTAEQLQRLDLVRDDFTSALKIVQPSVKREGFATIPDVTWADVGALGKVRDELHMAVVEPIRHPELFNVVGINAPSGVLLWGPPGCGKTLLAKAVASESRANFISVKGPELLNKYVGESERAVRQVFTRARASAPCVIFFDELDALVPRRDDNMSEASARVVNTLLTELDGLNSRKAVYVIGATNRPDMIDPAMVRPGRLDKLLYVDLPSSTERFEILRTHTSKTPIEAQAWDTVQDIVTSDKCDGFSGADIAALVREAATLALRSALLSLRGSEGGTHGTSNGEMDVRDPASIRVTADHFAEAATKTLPSVTKEQRRSYERMRDRYAGLPTKGRRMRELDARPDGVVRKEPDAPGPPAHEVAM